MINKDFVGYSGSDYITIRRRRSNKKIYFMLILLGLIAVIVLFLKNQFSNSQTKTKTETLASTLTPTPAGQSPLGGANLTSIPTPTKITNSQSLSEIVGKSLFGTKGSYGIAIENLNTNETFFKNEDQVFESASLYKLWVMAVVYQKIEDGSLNLNQILSEDVKTLNEKFRIDEKLAEQKTGKITLSVNDALNLMITKSDNYSGLLLASKIRLSSIAAFLKEYGLNASKVGTDGSAPVTSAFDIALFYKYLNDGKFANPDNTNEMINLLKKQVLNEKIPKQLPINAIVAHKTGELGLFSHDGGIVFAPKVTYIIVILSKSEAPDLANDRIANLSKAVFDYFNLGSK